MALALLCLVAVRTPCFAQTEGQAALKRFEEWKRQPAIYALEKRIARRVRDAWKPGGLVVIEAGVTDEPESPMGYRPGELRSLFEGFQILKYEETTGKYDWGPETIRLVRLVAVKK